MKEQQGAWHFHHKDVCYCPYLAACKVVSQLVWQHSWIAIVYEPLHWNRWTHAYLNSEQFALFGVFLEPGDTCSGNYRFTAHQLIQNILIIYEIKGNWMVFPAVLPSLSVGTMGKIYRVCRKYSLRNFHTCHPKISSDQKGGELVGAKHRLVKDHEIKISCVFWI